jgi:hypothetical protein
MSGLPGTLSSSDDEADVLAGVPGPAGDFGLTEPGFKRSEDRAVECFPALVGAGHVAAVGGCEPGQFVGHEMMVAGWPSALTLSSALTYDDGMATFASTQPPAHVTRKLTARSAWLSTTVRNLTGMAARALDAGDVASARVLCAELAPYAAELARFRSAGW